MRKMTTAFALIALLLSVGCGNVTDRVLADLAAKPVATTVADAKALYDEVYDLIRWHEDPAHEKMTPEQLVKVTALLDKRRGELVKVTTDAVKDGLAKVKSSVSKTLDTIGITIPTIDISKSADWVHGVGNPEVDKFAVPGRAPLDKRGAKDWP